MTNLDSYNATWVILLFRKKKTSFINKSCNMHMTKTSLVTMIPKEKDNAEPKTNLGESYLKDVTQN